MLPHPALLLTYHVGCVLTLKGDFCEVRSLWFLETQISRLGKVITMVHQPPLPHIPRDCQVLGCRPLGVAFWVRTG